jgi:hypothetical protein
MTQHMPLAVDMDGCLLATDMLMEALATAWFERPLLALAAPLWLTRGGRPLLKRKLALADLVDVAHLPLREDFVAFLRSQKASGRAVHLVSASDQAAVDAVARRLGLFDSATGSDGRTNLKAAAKRAFLQQRFPAGFVYAGDSRADLQVWPAAAGAILSGASPSVAATVAASGTPIEARFAPERASWRDWADMTGWTRLPFALVGLLIGSPAAAAVAILALAAAIAAGHVVAALANIKPDRRDKGRRNRPLAAGRIRLATAMQLGGILIGAAALFAALTARGL